MSDDVRGDGKQSLPEVVSTSKPTKETYLKARFDYETGNFQDLKQLSAKYALNYQYLRLKVAKERWKKYEVIVNKVSQKIAEKTVSRVDSFFNHLEKKGIYYEKLVEASQAQASRNSEGIPELEPVDLEKYARVEGTAIEWRKSALGIDSKVQLNADVTINVLGILNQVRTMQDKPEVAARVIDVEYLKECSKNLV